MGGYGSTRWAGYERKTCVEESLTLTADHFTSHPSGTLMTVRWGNDNVIRLVKHATEVTIAYQLTKTAERVQETVVFEQPNNRRWYFRCPSCKRLAGKLYKPFDRVYFRCRLCHDLTYRSVQERRKYQGLARIMAGETGMPARQWEKYLNSDWG